MHTEDDENDDEDDDDDDVINGAAHEEDDMMTEGSENEEGGKGSIGKKVGAILHKYHYRRLRCFLYRCLLVGRVL